MGWEFRPGWGLHGKFRTFQEDNLPPYLKDTVPFLIIQNFQTLYYHIKDTKCQLFAQ